MTHVLWWRCGHYYSTLPYLLHPSVFNISSHCKRNLGQKTCGCYWSSVIVWSRHLLSSITLSGWRSNRLEVTAEQVFSRHLKKQTNVKPGNWWSPGYFNFKFYKYNFSQIEFLYVSIHLWIIYRDTSQKVSNTHWPPWGRWLCNGHISSLL